MKKIDFVVVLILSYSVKKLYNSYIQESRINKTGDLD